jgi:hypothetical protein
MKQLKIKTINQSHLITEALGISEERAKELSKAVLHARIDNQTITDIGEAVSEICNHANELFYACIIIGEGVAMQRMQSEFLEAIIQQKK